MDTLVFFALPRDSRLASGFAHQFTGITYPIGGELLQLDHAKKVEVWTSTPSGQVAYVRSTRGALAESRAPRDVTKQINIEIPKLDVDRMKMFAFRLI
jgi:hypothetical protein